MQFILDILSFSFVYLPNCSKQRVVPACACPELLDTIALLVIILAASLLNISLPTMCPVLLDNSALALVCHVSKYPQYSNIALLTQFMPSDAASICVW